MVERNIQPKITLTPETILKILKIYYRETEDFIGEIVLNKNVVTKTHYSEDYDVANIYFTMQGTMEYLGEKIPYSREIAWWEAEEIIKESLKENNMNVKDLTLNTEIKDEWDGTEMSGHAEKRVEFDGVDCYVELIEKKKRK